LIRGVLFDYGDTLIRKRDAGTILREILADLRCEVDSRKLSRGFGAFAERWDRRYKDFPRGRRWTEEIRVDCDRASLRAIGFKKNLDTLAREVTRRWYSYERRVLFRDVKPTLRVLKRMELRLGIVSQNPMTGRRLRREVRALGIAEYFRIIMTSEDTKYDKPDPRLFEEASKRIRLEPAELCFVGNSYANDVLGARSAGIAPVLLDRERREESRDCLVITSLLSLPSLLRGGEVSDWILDR